MGKSKRLFSVGVCGLSYFLNMSPSGGLNRYTLCKVNLPGKVYWKVAVNKSILLELQSMKRRKALMYCHHLMKTRKQISMGDRGVKNGKQGHVRGVA